MILFFLFTPSQTEPKNELLQLFSLILITPVALFFGKQYLRGLQDEEKIKILEEEEKIMEEQIQGEESDILLWTCLDLKKNLTAILDETSQLLADVSHLNTPQRERILSIRKKALKLLQSSQKLKNEVDKTTNERAKTKH